MDSDKIIYPFLENSSTDGTANRLLSFFTNWGLYKLKHIDIEINKKIATITTKNAFMVCGNNDYIINFDFSEEWDDAEEKTARFIFGNGYYEDVKFTGSSCNAPIILNVREVFIGVYAGELKTTTPARVPCKKSVMCDDVAGVATGRVIVTKGDDGKSAYEIAVENGFEGTEKEWIESFGSGTAGFSPIVDITEIDGGHRISITDTKGEKTFDVLNGKDGTNGTNGVDGKDGEKGDKGDKGDPYTLTEADKTEIANAVLDSLAVAEGGLY